MSMGLTQVQANTLTFLKNHRDQKGVMPSYEEIANHLGLKSRGRVCKIIGGLEERGVIRRMPTKARAIEIVDDSETRSVTVSADLWPALVRYAIEERINLETAVNQFVRDGIEGA